MSDLGEISAEVQDALARLERVCARFAELDRQRLAAIQAQIGDGPNGRQAAAMISRARMLLREAAEAAVAARRAGAGWLSQHGSAESGRSAGLSTPGGRAYYPPEEPKLRRAAAALPEFPGEYTLDAHGDSEHVFIGEQVLSAQGVVELIEADSEWRHRPIRLFSCNTGRGEAPIAQEVATLSKVKVTAPDGLAWSAADGRHGVAPIVTRVVNGAVVEVPDFDREGSWREFRPG